MVRAYNLTNVQHLPMVRDELCEPRSPRHQVLRSEK
jgi:hypothetical protein